jgi:hypothetical protein
MSPEESQKLLDLAKAWETAAESHRKEMRRNRSFAQPGKENYQFYLAESAREEIKAQLCESHSNRLEALVNELLSSDKAVVPESKEA